MITGECRVEPLGLTPGRQLTLDGLRLRLDLRIVPGEGGAAAAAVWRVEEAHVATLRLGVPAVYRRAAVLAGVGALALAVLVWFAGTRTASEERAPPSGAHAISTSVAARGGASPGLAGELGGAAGAAGASGTVRVSPVSGSASVPGPGSLEGVAPRVAPVPAETPPSAEPALSAPPAPSPPAPSPPPAEAPARSSAPARAPTAAEGARQPAEPARARPPARAALSRDMLELFDDTK